jgi:hypothetical protein
MCAVKRLAITISGAVSLGCYEAGVLYEVLSALTDHNSRCKPDDRIEVDVLTGASAGAMTAGIAGQILLGNRSQPWEVYDNPFYNAWVKAVDLKLLARMQRGENIMMSLLSSDAIQEIATKYLPVTFEASARHPVAPPRRDLWLGLALTNLDGVDFEAPSLNKTKFIYTRYQDGMVRKLEAPPASDWTEIQQAALASGAFPYAFRIRSMVRQAADFVGAAPGPWPRTFAYTDGGVFDNEPLGMARNLATKLDQDPGDNDRRFYLFVSPSAMTSTKAKKPLKAEQADFVATGKALVSSIFYQARFRDWVEAESVNSHLDVLDERAGELAEALLGDPGLVEPLARVGSELASRFTRSDGRDPDSKLSHERIRLRGEYRTLGGDPGYPERIEAALGAGAVQAWLDAILVLEYAGRLSDKAQMVIYQVTAEDSELASGALFAFAGFFDEKYRRHDYEVGREKARDWLKNLKHGVPAGAVVPSLGPVHYEPKDPPPEPDPGLRGITLERIPSAPKELLRDVVCLRADTAIDEHLSSWYEGPLRFGLKLLVRRMVGKRLGL